MITIEQAKALKDGDVVWSLNAMASGHHYTKWTVFTPAWDDTWQDERIIKYLKTPFGIKSYLFNNQLHRFYLAAQEEIWS